jgi:hypothetical protein
MKRRLDLMQKQLPPAAVPAPSRAVHAAPHVRPGTPADACDGGPEGDHSIRRSAWRKRALASIGGALTAVSAVAAAGSAFVPVVHCPPQNARHARKRSYSGQCIGFRGFAVLFGAAFAEGDPFWAAGGDGEAEAVISPQVRPRRPLLEYPYSSTPYSSTPYSSTPYSSTPYSSTTCRRSVRGRGRTLSGTHG